jgi:hypothetical protein
MYGIVHAFADEKHKDTQGHRQEGLNDQYSVFDRKIHGIWEGGSNDSQDLPDNRRHSTGWIIITPNRTQYIRE